MRNQFISTAISKSDASGRGAPYGAARSALGAADFIMMPGSAVEATVVLQEMMAQNWSCWNRYYKEVYWLVRPYYMFPLEMTQHYYSFMFGCPQCLSEPVGRQRKTQWLASAEQESSEVLEQAMDVATGACNEMWVDEEEEEAAAMVA